MRGGSFTNKTRMPRGDKNVGQERLSANKTTFTHNTQKNRPFSAQEQVEGGRAKSENEHHPVWVPDIRQLSGVWAGTLISLQGPRAP